MADRNVQVATDDGLPLHVEVGGRGAPLVLVGNDLPLRWWAPLRQRLESDHTVVTFDYRAPDGWDAGPTPRDSVVMAADVSAVLDALGWREAVNAVGWSRGALVTYHLAAKEPERLGRLVLLAPVAPWEDLLRPAEPPASLGVDEADPLGSLARAAFSPEYAEQHLDEARGLFAFPPATAHRVAREDEPASHAETIPHPTLVLHGDADAIVAHEHGVALGRRLPAATLHLLAGASHAFPYEDPDDTARNITDHLQEALP